MQKGKKRKTLRKKRWRASYTVEASVIVPLVIVTMALAMKMGIYLYQEIEAQTEQTGVAGLWEVENFYKYQAVKEVLND